MSQSGLIFSLSTFLFHVSVTEHCCIFPTQTYKRRWYILILFSLVCFTQGLMWNTFGPISTSSERVFDWEDSTIAWLSALGGLAFLLTSFPMYWLMQTKGKNERQEKIFLKDFLCVGVTLFQYLRKIKLFDFQTKDLWGA